MKVKLWFLIFGVFYFCFDLGNAKSQEYLTDIDSLFVELQTDTLHVYAGLVQSPFTGGPIPSTYVQNFNFYKKGLDYVGISKFYVDKDKKYKAYLLKVDGNTYRTANIYLVAYQLDSINLIFSDEIAAYKYLSSSYEETQNAWIADFNGDGNLDIGIYNQLIDYEMSTDESPNTSGSKQFIYLFNNGKFELHNWDLDILKKFPLIKGK